MAWFGEISSILFKNIDINHWNYEV